MIGSRFGDIFRGNSGKAGLLVAVVDQKIIEELWDFVEEHPAAPITVDLAGRQITAEGFQAEFEIDDYTRWRLMEGLDDIGLTLRHVDQIDAFERNRPSYRPKTLPAKVASRLVRRSNGPLASRCLPLCFSLQDTKMCKPSDCLVARSSLALGLQAYRALPKFPAGLEPHREGKL